MHRDNIENHVIKKLNGNNNRFTAFRVFNIKCYTKIFELSFVNHKQFFFLFLNIIALNMLKMLLKVSVSCKQALIKK